MVRKLRFILLLAFHLGLSEGVLTSRADFGLLENRNWTGPLVVLCASGSVCLHPFSECTYAASEAKPSGWTYLEGQGDLVNC